MQEKKSGSSQWFFIWWWCKFIFPGLRFLFLCICLMRSQRGNQWSWSSLSSLRRSAHRWSSVASTSGSSVVIGDYLSISQFGGWSWSSVIGDHRSSTSWLFIGGHQWWSLWLLWLWWIWWLFVNSSVSPLLSMPISRLPPIHWRLLILKHFFLPFVAEYY